MMRINLASTARNALIPPLVFGDVVQIQAVRILSMLSELEDLYVALPEKTRECDYCDGQGDSRCGECGHYTSCRKCGGSGKITMAFNESAWLEESTLRKHLAEMRAELAEACGGAGA